jgi:hypothetical protein
VKAAVRGAVEPYASPDGSIELSNAFLWAVGDKP